MLTSNDSPAEVVSELRSTLQESMTELRYISRGLALPDLKELTLIEIIDRVISEHQRRTNTSIDLDFSPDRESLAVSASMSVNLTLYRTIQEGLMNAYRHAEGKGQYVRVERRNGEILVTVSDSGPGFSLDEIQKRERLGLHGLRERIESLGGVFDLASKPGQGTVITCSIPLTSQ
jgi:signal transduction histidine kinase